MYKKILTILSLLFFILPVSKSALAEEPIEWGIFNGWTVYSMPEFGYGCSLMSPAYADGTVMFLGFDYVDNEIYTSLLNRDWASLNDGDKYKMIIDYNPNGFWEGIAEVINFGEGIGQLYMSVDNSYSYEYIEDFALKDSVKFTINKYELANLTLKGSYNGIEELLRCQEAVNSLVSNNNVTDFMSKYNLKRSKPKDPFLNIDPIK